MEDSVQDDPLFGMFADVFEKFKNRSLGVRRSVVREEQDVRSVQERKKPYEFELKEKEEKDGVISKRKLKQQTRMSVAELKFKVSHPELVEMHDVTGSDPLLLLELKATRNSVPVPRHWCSKRKYLQGKRGVEKRPFMLPDFIRRTGIMEMRQAVQEKEDAKSMKAKQREKIRPKLGKIDIDYQKLHDAFFKWQTKPKMNIHGDLYHEGKEFETRLKEKKPGDLSNDLRTALGMPTGANAHKCPPPWLIAMQRYGPPPSYPNLKIPGLNARIPDGCSFGYHVGGWGKPPVDEYGRPLYGDVFGLTTAQSNNNPEEYVDKSLWGEIEQEEEEEEIEEDEEESEQTPTTRKEIDETGLVTPAEGAQTPSGFSSVTGGVELPSNLELRKRRIEAEMENDEPQEAYAILPEKKVERIGKDMMASTHVYDTTALKKSQGIEVSIDPSDLDAPNITAKYEQSIKEQGLGREDLSDMVVEHAVRQKRKKQETSSKSKDKKYKDFKF